MRAPVPAGFAFPMGTVLAVAATFLAVGLGATREPVVSVVIMVAVVALIAYLSTAAAAAVTAVLCWLAHSGFVLGRAGELTLGARAAHDGLVIGLGAMSSILLVAALRSRSRVIGPRVEVRAAAASTRALVGTPTDPDRDCVNGRFG